MSKPYFIALTGAKKNVGDFLITSRALNLLDTISPEYDYILHPHWKKVESVEFINNSQGIIILGGPGFRQNMFPGVYKIVDNVEDINVPIHTLGVGWKGVPGDKTTEKLYRFNNTSTHFLEKMNESVAGMSCRDYQTERVLINNGFENVTMTGCPVWYDINSLKKDFIPPSKIKKLVYTPAQDSFYYKQSIEVLEFLVNKYSEAEIIVSFHRGIGQVDQFTTEEDAENTKKLAEASENLGAKIVDVSFDDTKLSFYDSCDLHIGYRVHAHIYFLSKRLPSILLHEDGRGNGVSEALNSPGINAYKSSKFYSKFFGVFNRNSRILSLYKKMAFKLEPKIIHNLNNLISELENNNYAQYKKISAHIDENYNTMKNFIKKITNKSKGE